MIKGFVSIILISVLGITLLSLGLYRFAIQPEFSQTMTYGLMYIGGLLSMYGLLAMFYRGLSKKAY